MLNDKLEELANNVDLAVDALEGLYAAIKDYSDYLESRLEVDND